MAWVPVVLVVVGLAVAAYVLGLWHERGLPTLGPRRERPSKRPRGGGGKGRQAPPATGEGGKRLDMSMDDWLADQAAGRGNE